MTWVSFLMSTAKYLLGTAATLTVLTLIGLYFYQTHLIYPSYLPENSRTIVDVPVKYGIPYEDVELETSDGVKLKAYLIYARGMSEMQSLEKGGEKEAERVMAKEKKEGEMGRREFCKSKPTIIFFHANAGNMGHRINIAKALWQSTGSNILMLSYRGYGLSGGKASEKGLRIDAQTALDFITNHKVLEKTKIIVYGQSIGGCVCIDLASRNPSTITAMIIENTPLSLPTLIPILLPALSPIIKIPYLLTEKWDAELSIPKLSKKLKVLGLEGQQDELVRPGQMKGIRKRLEGRVGKAQVGWKEFEKGTHNDTFAQPEYFNIIKDFIANKVMAA